MPIIKNLYRYPVKGMTGEALQQVIVQAGQPIPLDRRFALAHGDTVFDPQQPQFLPKTRFLMLMKNAKLASLHTVYDDNTGILSIYRDETLEELLTCGMLDEAGGRSRLENFFKTFLGADIRGEAHFLEADNHSFSDVPAKVLSCINLESIEALEATMSHSVNPLRFRGNVYFDGAPAWSELDWTGKRLRLGNITAKVLKPIERCAATNVNPATAERDMRIPQTLVRQYGHPHMGVYVTVEETGSVAVGDSLTLI